MHELGRVRCSPTHSVNYGQMQENMRWHGHSTGSSRQQAVLGHDTMCVPEDHPPVCSSAGGDGTAWEQCYSSMSTGTTRDTACCGLGGASQLAYVKRCRLLQAEHML